MVEKGRAGSVCPVLINHSDSTGVWSHEDLISLLRELSLIEEEFFHNPPQKLNAEWKVPVAKTFGITPANLAECFFDIDGENLFRRLRELAEIGIEKKLPIIFQ